MLKTTNNTKIRKVIDDIALSGGLPATKLNDLMDIVEERYLKKYKYRIYLTPKRLGSILSEFINVENIHKNIKGKIAVSYVINQMTNLPPLISDGSFNMVHKCEWKKYIILPEGRFKKCKKCGLILHDEETEALDILVSKK